MNNDTKIVGTGNDAVMGGKVDIVYSRGARVSPLHIDFTREDGFKCHVSLSHHTARELLVLLAKNV